MACRRQVVGPYTQHPEAARGQLQYISRVSRCRVHLEPHPVSGPGGLAVVALRELWDPALRTGIRTVHRYSAWPSMPVFCDCGLPAIWAPRIFTPDPRPGSASANPAGMASSSRSGSSSTQAEGAGCGPAGCGPISGVWEWRCRNAGRAGMGCQARDGPSLLNEWDDEALSFGSLPEMESSSGDDSDEEGDGGDNSSDEEDDNDF